MAWPGRNKGRTQSQGWMTFVGQDMGQFPTTFPLERDEEWVGEDPEYLREVVRKRK